MNANQATADPYTNSLAVRMCRSFCGQGNLSYDDNSILRDWVKKAFFAALAMTLVSLAMCEVERNRPNRRIIEEMQFELVTPQPEPIVAAAVKSIPVVDVSDDASPMSVKRRVKPVSQVVAAKTEADKASVATSINEQRVASVPAEQSASPAAETTAPKVADATPVPVAAAAEPVPVQPAPAKEAMPSSMDAGSTTSGDFGQLGTPRAPRTKYGNIRPYLKQMVAVIKQCWTPATEYEKVVLAVDLNKDGKVLGAQVVQSSGNDKLDHSLIAAAQSTQFAHLPEWYTGEHLKVQMILTP